MAFKSAFIAHVPDADPQKHKCKIETELYSLYVRLVKGQKQALTAVNDLVENAGIHSILLCPGFTHEQIAEISKEVGEKVGVSVARGDSPSGKIVKEAMAEEGWFDKN